MSYSTDCERDSPAYWSLAVTFSPLSLLSVLTRVLWTGDWFKLKGALFTQSLWQCARVNQSVVFGLEPGGDSKRMHGQ